MKQKSQPSRSPVAVVSFIFTLLLLASAAAPALRAQETVVHLDPAKTKVEISVSSTLHNVHGTFKLKSGEVRFDPATGKAAGTVIVDALSGDTSDEGRDKKMHQHVLESQKFAEIVFTPGQVRGKIAPQGTSEVEVSGLFRIHGQDHDLTMTISVEPKSGKQILATSHFAVPYVKWGLKSPSNFLLKVNDTVDVEIHAVGDLNPGLN